MIVDGHSDLLFALSRFEQTQAANAFQKIYYPDFQQGAVEGGIFVLWGDPDAGQSVTAQVQHQLQMLQELQKEDDCMLQLLQYTAEIMFAEVQNKIYFLLGAEGLDGYPQEIQSIDWLYEQGVRHIGLTWNYANGFASGVLADGGLTALGRIAVQHIQQKKMLLDVAHLNDASIRDTLALADGPILASHCNSRRLCNVPRNLTDAQMKAIAGTGGVIGVNSYPPFIAEYPEHHDLEHLADHLLHIAYLVGPEHVGFGFDFNYWDDTANAIVLPELAGNSQVQQFVLLLQKRGFSEQELQLICKENLLQLIRRTLT